MKGSVMASILVPRSARISRDVRGSCGAVAGGVVLMRGRIVACAHFSGRRLWVHAPSWRNAPSTIQGEREDS